MHRGIQRELAAVVTTLAFLAAGCAGRSEAAGSGEDVDACAAYPIYESLEEPSPSDPDEMRAYARAVRRVMDRVDDVKVPVEDEDDLVVPKRILAAYETIDRSMQAILDDLNGAGDDPERVAGIANALAENAPFIAADRLVGDFYAEECPRGGGR